MEKNDAGMPGLLLLAGIGAGVLTGALLGSVLSRRLNEGSTDPVSESIELLRGRAQKVLAELSNNVHAAIERNLESYDRPARPTGPTKTI